MGNLFPNESSDIEYNVTGEHRVSLLRNSDKMEHEVH